MAEMHIAVRVQSLLLGCGAGHVTLGFEPLERSVNRTCPEMAIRPWPEHWSGHVLVDVQRAAHKSCGDLLFSSHTIFMLTGWCDLWSEKPSGA
eukprot:1157332-Pelagomonas_calceolata.AAC.6